LLTVSRASGPLGRAARAELADKNPIKKAYQKAYAKITTGLTNLDNFDASENPYQIDSNGIKITASLNLLDNHQSLDPTDPITFSESYRENIIEAFGATISKRLLQGDVVGALELILAHSDLNEEDALDVIDDFGRSINDYFLDNITIAPDSSDEDITKNVQENIESFNGAVSDSNNELVRPGSYCALRDSLNIGSLISDNAPPAANQELELSSGVASPKKVSGKIYITDQGLEHQTREYELDHPVKGNNPTTLTVSRSYFQDEVISTVKATPYHSQLSNSIIVRASMSNQGGKNIKIVIENLSRDSVESSTELNLTDPEVASINGRPERLDALVAKRADQEISKKVIAAHKKREKKREESRRREQLANNKQAQQEASRLLELF